ncbi:hypothetical protein OG264_02875 [Streptomyces xanthophaeus]|uniref:hypothetical protein n=1 Tax=Streptomyces xanthophaeus TaxID=67385 RepID=UPI003868DEF4|nr:hypothetical protein OG264_02875 [Streptomyces xanthophaeus]WST64479.1 hypothetical protein OG605_35485 [Streptomyces xanthophaeus]
MGHPQRGTPEPGALREQGEESARAGIGAATYDRTILPATLTDPHLILGELLAP